MHMPCREKGVPWKDALSYKQDSDRNPVAGWEPRVGIRKAC